MTAPYDTSKAVPNVGVRMPKSSPFEQQGGSSRIAGKADHEATVAYTVRFPDLQPSFGLLGGTGLMASHAGFGGYRVDYRIAPHVLALEEALTSGVNLIDTSANYGDGNSEMLIAIVLEDLIDRGHIRREEVIIVTKGGYIQGQNYERALERVRQGNPFPEVVEYDTGLWHCIHPEFLDDQLHRSMSRMNVDHVDVYLLHNPEYYLSWAVKRGQTVEQARHEYDRRIQAAFEWLEAQATAGSISYYGISSNTFPKPLDEADFTSLEQIFAIAESLSPDHHFRVIQLPINLFERGGVLELNQSNGTETVLEFAHRQGLGVLVNRPLNAIMGNGMVRLADFPVDHVPEFDDVQQSVDRVAGLEEAFEAGMLPALSIGVEQRNAVKQMLTVGRTLQQYWKRFGTVEHWNDVSDQYLVPRLNYGLSLLQPAIETAPGLQTWLKDYIDVVNDTLWTVTSVYRIMADRRSRQLHDALNPLLPESAQPLSLSQKAVLLLRSVPGVSTVLVGMRQNAYVQDVVAGLQHASLDDGLGLWNTLDETLDQVMEG